MGATVIAAAEASAELPWWVTVLVGVAGALAALVVALVGAVARERARRRETYAAAVRTIISWMEYPYRIRRRTSDDAVELGRLRDLGHDLQQDLEYHRALLAGDSERLGDLYGEVVARAKRRAGKYIDEAWQATPITEPASMPLGGWGPAPLTPELACLREAIGARFGWRRFKAWIRDDQTLPEAEPDDEA